MLLSLTLSRINLHMVDAIIDIVHVAEGDGIPLGGKFLDLTVDLSAATPHDCPPITHYRMALRDRVWLRRLDVAAGDRPEVGASLALFSTTPDEALEGGPARPVRVAIAGIIPQSVWNEG